MAENYAVELRNVTKKFGQVVAVDDVSLRIGRGEFYSLLGPSGCGKTTTLRMIAGFEMPTRGEVLIEGEVQGHLPPHQRPVNTVFQNYALFPHMTVEQNIAFGLEMRKVPKDEIRRRVGEMLEMVHLTGMGKRKPAQLSGGQQQRVALARALVNRPKVLLLDEPLGALDLKLRQAMQLELKALQEQVGITFIYVTHDQGEALTMSDYIAVMNRGRVLQLGTPEEIYENPTSRFVADFIGETNFIPVTVREGGQSPRVAIGDQVVEAVWAQDGLPVGAQAVLSIRPEKIALHRQASDAPGKAVIPGKVTNLMYLGTDTRYTVAIAGGSEVVVRMQNVTSSEHFFRPGETVALAWSPHHGRVMEAD